ncbi:phosphate-binding protein [Aequorivita soesokkakensis]|jgi:phosphate transport system substrate-binding protein|uniref:Phosphate-binding protein n=1 Tax=Aequorivita soesokkakensis TaxID=1385699 RepID=A0A1A9LFK9_9FLAO|nr:phosphate ABC transporter substrate-binding protein [Aequorivita soesokkakensis]OAD91531.1 phosphate-binding protein [Aequorivita soesokkakensis]
MKKNLWIFCIPFLFIACSNNNKTVINASGSTTVLPVISIAAEQFMKTHPDVKIIVNAGGSGVGINQVGAQQIEIGMISRNITEKEIAQYPNTNFVVIPIGRDAVVPVVSSEIYDAGIKSLSIEQLAKIYRGEIANWKELNGPDKDILVIDKEAARGTRHVFMEIVLGDKEAEAAGADLVLGANNEEQTAIVQSDAALGILSNAWMNKDVKGIAIIMPNGEIIEPTLANIINGKFPIIRDLDLITNGEPTGITKEFIDYILSAEGQKIVEENEYVSISK